MIRFIAKLLHQIARFFDYLSPAGDLLARFWIGWIFFKAGLVKIQAWQATMMLFQHEYHVPLLTPLWAAYLGTAAELVLPILLVLGLGGRLMVFIFFVYNIVAMVSYPFLWTAAGWAGLSAHISWGLLLLMLMLHGPGKLSIDHLIRREYQSRLKKSGES